MNREIVLNQTQNYTKKYPVELFQSDPNRNCDQLVARYVSYSDLTRQKPKDRISKKHEDT